MLPPAFDEHLGLLQRVKDFRVQQLVSGLAVERLVVAVLPGTAGFDEQRLHADPRQPFPHGDGRERGAIVGPDMVRRAIPAILTGQADDVRRQGIFIRSALRALSLCRAMLTDRGTSAPLGHFQPGLQMIDTGTAAGGAQ